jgi:hypothetical protein
MSTLAIVWLVLFGVASLLFFGLAAIITVFGFRDLRDLLGGVTRQVGESGKEISSDRT